MLERQIEPALAVEALGRGAEGDRVVEKGEGLDVGQVRFGDLDVAVAEDQIEVARVAVNDDLAGDTAGHRFGVFLERVDELVEIKAVEAGDDVGLLGAAGMSPAAGPEFEPAVGDLDVV